MKSIDQSDVVLSGTVAQFNKILVIHSILKLRRIKTRTGTRRQQPGECHPSAPLVRSTPTMSGFGLFLISCKKRNILVATLLH